MSEKIEFDAFNQNYTLIKRNSFLDSENKEIINQPTNIKLKRRQEFEILSVYTLTYSFEYNESNCMKRYTYQLIFDF